MKKHLLSLFCLLVLGCGMATAQHNMIFRFKAEGLYGKNLQGGSSKSSAAGGEVAMELPLYGNKNWHYTYNFPSVGFAAGYMNLLDADTTELHHAVFTYPYFLYPFIHTPMFAANLRMGAGFGAFADDKFRGLSESGDYTFAGYTVLTGGLTFDIHLAERYGNPWSKWMIQFGANCFMMNDINFDRHKQTLIIPAVNLGVKYTPNGYPLPIKHPARPVYKVCKLEITAGGGANQLDTDDQRHYYPNFSLDGGLYWPFSNAYRMGCGLELFYNDIYTDYDRTINPRYNFIEEDKFSNHLRGGIFWANDLTIERFCIGAHFGFYAFNPIRIPKEYNGIENNQLLENWMYWKLVTKYRFSKHFYAMAQMKGHLNKFEFFETGIGWTMPDFGDRINNPFSRLRLFHKEDPDELRIEGVTNTPRPFREQGAFDE